MHTFSKVALALATLSSYATADILPKAFFADGVTYDLVISKQNTLNSTSPLNRAGGPTQRDIESIANLKNRGLVERANNLVIQLDQFPWPGTKGATQVKAYIVGKDASGAIAFVNKNGQYYYPKASGSSNTNVPPQNIEIALPTNGNALNVTLPGVLTSAQIQYVVNGTLQYAVNGANGQTQLVMPSASASGASGYNNFWGFTEFTYSGGSTLNMNPTAVDFAGCPGTFLVYNGTGKYQGGGSGILPGAANQIASYLQQQAQKDGQPWDQLAIYNNKGQLVRVDSPTTFRGLDNQHTTAFNGYWEPYIDQVWQKYQSSPLTLQSTAGNVQCTTSGNTMTCSGESQTRPKPTTADIFGGCPGGNGFFSTAGNNQNALDSPILCAAFVRSTLLVNGGNTQPVTDPTLYYANAPTDYYGKWTHNQSYSNGGRTGLGYTFPYDDTPNNPNQSGDLDTTNAALVELFIGGFGWGGYSAGQYA